MSAEESLEFLIPSTLPVIDEAVARVTAFAGSRGLGESEAFGFDIAVREAVANAVKHGNGLDESKLVEIRATAAPDRLEISIRDRGDGFIPEEVPDPTAEGNLLNASGRGLLFMRTFMDTVDWAAHPDGGTVVTMRKML